MSNRAEYLHRIIKNSDATKVPGKMDLATSWVAFNFLVLPKMVSASRNISLDRLFSFLIETSPVRIEQPGAPGIETESFLVLKNFLHFSSDFRFNPLTALIFPLLRSLEFKYACVCYVWVTLHTEKFLSRRLIESNSPIWYWLFDPVLWYVWQRFHGTLTSNDSSPHLSCSCKKSLYWKSQWSK